ncbi:potassium transporter Kup [Pseudodesulfovibrio tunisiensis]|uniref:potassium transporter Kup n=1 Tax=Pseudodesulfovibrio tunisiensis TaxID=463192 RepID=UPI001FB1D029|nr:KUP/HAK/KT family potassium transporter [Pseudodesulfovibrio tunisiensis]
MRKRHTSSTAALSLAALGIVFGDIGTSPLYALKACFSGFHAVPATPNNVLGVLSLVFWSLTAVISVKYVAFVMRADNQGEGGIFALFAVLPESWRNQRKWVVPAALFGAALLYGDGIITPAISVLSALEGLSVATSAADAYVVPLTCIILAALFAVQRHGTSRIGAVFGPVMLVWFCAIAILGIMALLRHPQTLAALNPMWGMRFFAENGRESTIVLGAVVLCVTGAEALYADMGHFGAKPIRLAWYFVAMPALVLNYFGQGAVLMMNAEATASPFYALAPRSLILPLVGLSTCATIIASQAVISGVFSLTRQAIQLGYLPRVHIFHTSSTSEGQIYCPEANWLMAAACLALVAAFRSSDNLAGAYGIAITSTMVITTLLYFAYLRKSLGRGMLTAGLICAGFLVFDLGFFLTNLAKLDGGGWIPLTIAGTICLCMMIWARGRATIRTSLAPELLPESTLDDLLRQPEIRRIPGCAVCLTASPRGIPPFLTRYVRLTHSLPEKTMIFSIITEPVPRIPSQDRIVLKVLDHGLYRIIARYGFAETPNIPLDLLHANASGLAVHPEEAVYFLGRESLLSPNPGHASGNSCTASCRETA